MLLMALMAAAPLAFAPDVPEEILDFRTWPVGYETTVERTVASDVMRAGLTLKFVQTRGICPQEAGADCAYTVRYEYRRLMVDGEQMGLVQRYIVRGANGVTAEGIGYYDPERGANIFYRKDTRWLSEDPRTEEFVTAVDFFGMLYAYQAKPQN